MPCEGGYTSEQLLAMENEKRKIARENQLRTQIACAALGYLEANGHMMELEQTIEPDENGFTVKEMRAWWNNHKKEDERRRKREAKEAEKRAKAEADKNRRQALLNAMDPEDRKLFSG